MAQVPVAQVPMAQVTLAQTGIFNREHYNDIQQLNRADFFHG